MNKPLWQPSTEKRDNSLSPFEVENVENVEGGLVDQCLG